MFWYFSDACDPLLSIHIKMGNKLNEWDSVYLRGVGQLGSFGVDEASLRRRQVEDFPLSMAIAYLIFFFFWGHHLSFSE